MIGYCYIIAALIFPILIHYQLTKRHSISKYHPGQTLYQSKTFLNYFWEERREDFVPVFF